MDTSIHKIQQISLTGILLPTNEWEKIFRSWSAKELGTTKYSGRLRGEIKPHRESPVLQARSVCPADPIV